MALTTPNILAADLRVGPTAAQRPQDHLEFKLRREGASLTNLGSPFLDGLRVSPLSKSRNPLHPIPLDVLPPADH